MLDRFLVVRPDAPLSASRERRALFDGMLREDGHLNPAAFVHDARHTLRGVRFQGRSVLEVGSGRGLMALLLALEGARVVVSMEPEMIGSRSGMIALQQQRIAALGLDNVELLAADFNRWEPEGRTFDVLLSRASINHLHESAHRASAHPPTWNGYVEVARRMHRLLAPSGVAIVTDACRYGFFAAVRPLGITRPWNPRRTGIDWRYHQSPATWRDIFRQAGFARVEIAYPLPYRLRRLKGIADEALPNFFLTASFICRAYKEA